jgi:hypothetical protein
MKKLWRDDLDVKEGTNILALLLICALGISTSFNGLACSYPNFWWLIAKTYQRLLDIFDLVDVIMSQPFVYIKED